MGTFNIHAFLQLCTWAGILFFGYLLWRAHKKMKAYKVPPHRRKGLWLEYILKVIRGE